MIQDVVWRDMYAIKSNVFLFPKYIYYTGNLIFLSTSWLMKIKILTLRDRYKNSSHYANNIFKYIFVSENLRISIQIR